MSFDEILTAKRDGWRERTDMAPFVLRGSLWKNPPGSAFKQILRVTACALVFVWAQGPALAQHVGGHPAGGARPGGAGGGRMGVPPRAPIGRSPVVSGPRFVGRGARGFGFRQGPIRVFRQRVFFGRPFFRFGLGLGFNSLWWPNCGPSLGWAWGWGFDCYPTTFYGYSFENSLIFQPYETYVYVPAERDLVRLYLKDGAVYGVTDYWIVDGRLHFRMVEDDPTRPSEHVVPYDQLDVQKTTYVNSRRGFRMVARDEPWQQYLKDHPDTTPPDLVPPQNN
jgi:hypothetical protein